MILPTERYALPALLAIALCAGCLSFAASRTAYKPRTVIQVVTIRWDGRAAPEERRAAIDGIEKLAAEVPGIKNVWLRAIRVQPRDFMTAYAIEFEDQAAAERFARNPAREAWDKSYLPLIEDTRTQQVTN
jgi:hypothetical protein